MSEHVVAVRMQYDDAGYMAGVTRDIELTRQIQAAMKDGAPAVQQLVASLQQLGDKERNEAAAAEAAAKAKTAQINTTTAQSKAAAAAANATAAEARATTAEATAANAAALAAARLSTAQNQSATAAANAQRAQAQLQQTLDKIANDSAATVSGINSISSSLESATTMVKAFFGAWVVRETIGEARKLVMEGVNFNSELEQTRIGSAAIISTFANIYDAQGRLLKGAEAFNAAQQVGVDLTEKIKVKTLETTLLFSQMQDATRRSLAYELQYLTDETGKVASNKDLAKFTASFAQGAVAFGLTPEEIPNNLRALLTGRADPRHARFAAALLSEFGTNEQAREQMAEWHNQGRLIQELQERLGAFALAGQKAMNTYTGALSNLHDAWQQLLGEGTEGATKELTGDILTLRDSIVQVDKWGRATFNPELVRAITAVAETLAKGATFTVSIVKKIIEPGGTNDFMKAFGEEMESTFGGWVSKRTMAASILVPPLTPFLQMLDLENKKQSIIDSSPGLSRFNREKWDIGKGVFQLGYGFLGGDLDPFASPSSPRTRNPTNFFSEFKKVPPPKTDDLPTLKTKKKPQEEEEDAAAANKLADFQKFMEQFHVGAVGGTGNDPLAHALRQLTIERLQAIDHYRKAHKALADANEDWKGDLHDINLTFDFKEGDAVNKYVTEFQAAREKLSTKYAPAKQGDYETSNVNAKLDALREIDDVKSKFPSIAAEWTSLEKQVEDFYKKKLVDDAAASLTKINDQTLQAAKRTVELERQIKIDADTEIENQRIDRIVNSVDRELATRIAANDRWAAEEDKRAQIDLAGDEMKGLREQRLAVIEQARIQKNRAAEEAAFHARQALIAGTDEWLHDLDKRKDEIIPKIGITLQDTVIGALDATQSAIEKYFADIADGNAHLGASADALVHDLGQKWSKVFADAVSAPLHGGSVLDSFKQIEATFQTGGTLDKFLAGAGIGSFVGGFFGPNNKAQQGGAIGGGVGSIAGGIIGSALPGIGTAIGAEIGSVIGSMLGSYIGSLMPAGKDSITIAMHGLTLDNLRGPYTSKYGENQTTQDLGGGSSIDLQEKGISPAARADLIAQVHRKAEETMKGYQNIIDLFPDEVKEKLKAFHPTLTLSGGTESKDITDEGALQSLSDFLSNKLPKAAFSAYEPALRAGLAAMGEGQNRITQIMTYWGTMQGTELRDAVMAYVSALVSFAAIKKTIGEFGDPASLIPGSVEREARKAETATPLSHVVDLKAEIAGVVASLPKLLDVDDQLAAMEKLNSLSGQFFEGLVAGFQKIDELEKSTFASLDSFDEQVKLAGMGDQDKLNYYYKRMGELETELQTTKDPQHVADLVQQIEQYGQQALGLAGDNAQNRNQLEQIIDEVRTLAGADYAKGRGDLIAEQHSAFELLNTASNNLMRASNDLMGRGPGTGRGTPATGGGGSGIDDNGNPIDKTPIPPPGPGDDVGGLSLYDAFRSALDDGPIAIGTTGGAAAIVDSIDRLSKGLGVDDLTVHAFAVSPAILDSNADRASWARSFMEHMAERRKELIEKWQGNNSDDRSAEIVKAINALGDEMRRTRAAIANRSLIIEGDGAEFLRSVGFTLQEAVFQTLRDHPEVAVHLFNV